MGRPIMKKHGPAQERANILSRPCNSFGPIKARTARQMFDQMLGTRRNSSVAGAV